MAKTRVRKPFFSGRGFLAFRSSFALHLHGPFGRPGQRLSTAKRTIILRFLRETRKLRVQTLPNLCAYGGRLTAFYMEFWSTLAVGSSILLHFSCYGGQSTAQDTHCCCSCYLFKPHNWMSEMHMQADIVIAAVTLARIWHAHRKQALCYETDTGAAVPIHFCIFFLWFTLNIWRKLLG